MKAQRIWGGIVGLTGFLLSPLSWWNDLLVNVPLALGFGWLVGLALPGAFRPAVVVGYWLTNVLGFWMMHRGAARLFRITGEPGVVRSLWKDFGVATAYTALIVALLHLGWVQAPAGLQP